MKILQIKVKLGASAAKFERAREGSWLAQGTAPPVDGKAKNRVFNHLKRGESDE